MKNILIIEDEPDVRTNLEDLLNANNFKVVVSTDGSDALQKINYEMPQLIISDLIMPRMGGHRFYLEFKKIQGSENVPVILLTSSDVSRDFIKSIVLGVDAYLLKPYDATQLLTVINNLLKKSKNTIEG